MMENNEISNNEEEYWSLAARMREDKLLYPPNDFSAIYGEDAVSKALAVGIEDTIFIPESMRRNWRRMSYEARIAVIQAATEEGYI